MAKKKKWPYKFISPDQMEGYKKMTKAQLVDALVEKNSHLKISEKTKKDSEYLKEINKEISDFRKENSSVELVNCEGELKGLKELRDEKISDSIDEAKDLAGGFNDAINASKEHISTLLSLLSKAK